MVVRGFGIGMAMMPAMTAAYATLRPEQVNDATPQLNVLQRVGGSIGTAILTVVLQNGITANTPEPPDRGQLRPHVPVLVVVVGVSVVALLPTILLAVVERRRDDRPRLDRSEVGGGMSQDGRGPRWASCGSPPSCWRRARGCDPHRAPGELSAAQVRALVPARAR